MNSDAFKPRGAMILLVLGVLCAAALVVYMLIQSPWDRFAEEGRWLTTHIWGRISLLDLYSGFLLSLALIWLLEPRLWIRLTMVLLLPALGNPLLAFWLILRWRRLIRLARNIHFD